MLKQRPVRGQSVPGAAGLEQGLRRNWRQFWLLVLVNAFVGSMVGLERTVAPLLAQSEFDISSHTAALSFIACFGAVKAVTNLFAGQLSDRVGRRRVLIAGWLFGAPVPFLVMWAPTWGWILVANALLGVNQGLAWSATVIMKIDLVGPARRGLAMGLNEFAGYAAVAVAALGTGMIAQQYGLRPEPFYVGIASVAIGLALTLLFVRETLPFAHAEGARGEAGGVGPEAAGAVVADGIFAEQRDLAAYGAREPKLSSRAVLARTLEDPALFGSSQAGLVNNLNDGVAWGLFPIFFAASGLDLGRIAILTFAYPAVWAGLQIWTGALSDRVGRKALVAGGMALQGIALLGIATIPGFAAWLAMAALLGMGTAMVYPTLLAVVSDVAHPGWRASAVGAYRLWRDAGYVLGALLAGVLADALGMAPAIAAIGVITMLSGTLVWLRMPETAPRTAVSFDHRRKT